MDRKNNVYGASKIAINRSLERSDAKQLQRPPITLDASQRLRVEKAVREVCDHRRYVLRAIGVRTNHVHTVVTAMVKPEPVLDSFKAYATRKLRSTGLLSAAVKPWARHGSTVYLWKERDVAKAQSST